MRGGQHGGRGGRGGSARLDEAHVRQLLCHRRKLGRDLLARAAPAGGEVQEDVLAALEDLVGLELLSLGIDQGVADHLDDLGVVAGAIDFAGA